MKKYIISMVGSALILITGFVLMIISNDEFDLSYPAGFLVGFGVVLLIVSILNFVRIKRRTTVPYYDERQIKARGDAFKYAFFTLLTTLIADGIIRQMIQYDWANFFDGIMLHVFISLAVFVNYSIMNDAYLEINSNSKRLIILFVLIGLYNLILPIKSIIDNTLIEDGKITPGFVCLACAALMFSVAISLFVKNKIDKKKEIEEEYYEES